MCFRFLDNIAVLMHSPHSEDLGEFLKAVYSKRIADPGKVFAVPFNKGESVSFLENRLTIYLHLPKKSAFLLMYFRFFFNN